MKGTVRRSATRVFAKGLLGAELAPAQRGSCKEDLGQGALKDKNRMLFSNVLWVSRRRKTTGSHEVGARARMAAEYDGITSMTMR